jgi:hypothetical protein
MEVRDQTLAEAYEPHDIAQSVVESKLQAHGFDIHQHGTDDRHADEVYFGEGPDLRVEHDGSTVCYVEIKSKTDEAWFGRCNERHFREYVHFAADVDVPVFIWFALVDKDNERIQRRAWFEVEPTDTNVEGEVLDGTDTQLVFHEDDVYVVDGPYKAIDGGDLVGVDSDFQVTDAIPEVFGNRVVCLNEDQFRSFPWVLRQLGDVEVEYPRLKSVDTATAVSTDEDIDTTEYAADRETRQRRVDCFGAVQALLNERIVQNPQYDDVWQFRTVQGRMGPQLDEHTEIHLTLSDGDVDVVVDGAVIGSVDAV